MLYAIEAMEQRYSGLYGIVDHVVEECRSLEEAECVGRQMSYELMESYGIQDEIAEEAISEGFDEGTESYDNYIDEQMSENCEYAIFKVKETTKSIRELDKLFSDDPTDFIKTYCEEL